ncbi:hypothetical protein GE115_12505 [Agromyces sp. CFH 90414]|uniref:Uncharacterized protein n=1 Tax=Agromyces agglutinans TaxID=2662258 RepID=A0A6I2FFK2_9MICO|nr:hypothetical protein [Agromyces agglutinans]MRG60683.1 hypothetical protein [Agromyces agglutinans]
MSETSLPLAGARRRWARALRVAGVASLFGAVLLGTINLWSLVGPGRPRPAIEDFTLILGNWIPTTWEAEFALVLTSVMALMVASSLAPPTGSPPQRRVWATSMWALSILAIPSLGATLLTSGVLISTYSVLPNPSDGGCRIVVRETSVLLVGGGTVGVVQPGSVVVDWVRTYSADDGYTPFSAGTYRLEWSARVAGIDLWGPAQDPTNWTSDAPILCDR